jgi:hypothetical protein
MSEPVTESLSLRLRSLTDNLDWAERSEGVR